MNLYEAHKSLHFPCTDGSHAGKALLRSRDPGLPLAAGTAQGRQGQQGQQQPHPGDPRSRPALWAESATAGLASALPESARGWCREDGPGDDEGSAPGPQACTPQDGRLHWSVFPPTAPKHPRLSRLPGLVGSRDQPLTTLTDYRITVAAKQSHVSPTRLMAVQPEERGGSGTTNGRCQPPVPQRAVFSVVPHHPVLNGNAVSPRHSADAEDCQGPIRGKIETPLFLNSLKQRRPLGPIIIVREPSIARWHLTRLYGMRVVCSVTVAIDYGGRVFPPYLAISLWDRRGESEHLPPHTPPQCGAQCEPRAQEAQP